MILMEEKITNDKNKDVIRNLIESIKYNAELLSQNYEKYPKIMIKRISDKIAQDSIAINYCIIIED